MIRIVTEAGIRHEISAHSLDKDWLSAPERTPVEVLSAIYQVPQDQVRELSVCNGRRVYLSDLGDTWTVCTTGIGNFKDWALNGTTRELLIRDATGQVYEAPTLLDLAALFALHAADDAANLAASAFTRKPETFGVTWARDLIAIEVLHAWWDIEHAAGMTPAAARMLVALHENPAIRAYADQVLPPPSG